MSRSSARKEAGSVTVLTVLAFAVIAGAFLYVAVLGSRTSETTRVRVAADSAAMAAATVKAKVMNYEAFVLLADTVLLPLGQLSDPVFIAGQVEAEVVCLLIAGPTYCATEYPAHMAETAANQPSVDEKVTGWLDGLEALANELQEVGPQWAEFAASHVGSSDSYKGPGQRGVTAAASFPVPDRNSECSKLGIEMVDNTEKTGPEQREACHDRWYLEEAYIATSLDPLAMALDELGLVLTARSLVLGFPCAKTNKVPKLSDNWKDYSMSRGMAISEKPNDERLFSIMDGLRRSTRSSMVKAGDLLGIGCAEHYAQDHYDGNESLWHLDWRARLVPCHFDQSENIKVVEQCGAQRFPGAIFPGPDHVLKMQLQFERERLLGAPKHWKY